MNYAKYLVAAGIQPELHAEATEELNSEVAQLKREVISNSDCTAVQAVQTILNNREQNARKNYKNEVTIQVIAERINIMQNDVRDLKAMKVWKCQR